MRPMKKAAPLLCVLALGVLACKRSPAQSPEQFALGFVEAARAGTPGPAWVDEALISQVRRAQRLALAARAGARSPVLAKVWNQNPDVSTPVDQRGEKQRERAAQAIKQQLVGECSAARD